MACTLDGLQVIACRSIVEMLTLALNIGYEPLGRMTYWGFRLAV